MKSKPTMVKAGLAITKEMLIGDIVQKYPQGVETLLSHGMHCIGCHVAYWETIEQAAIAHGIDVNKLIKELNSKVKQ